MSISRFALRLGSLALGLGLALPVLAAGLEQDHARPRCQPVRGQFVEYIVDPFLSPNDPLGRVVTVTTGSLQAIGTGILIQLSQGPSAGTLAATTRHLFVLNEEDQITADGLAIFTPIPDSADVTDVLTLTINGGLGRYAGATGQIVARGRGFHFFPLPPGPTAGTTFFVFRYTGEICVH